jgi:hypothetical protein
MEDFGYIEETNHITIFVADGLDTIAFIKKGVKKGGRNTRDV